MMRFSRFIAVLMLVALLSACATIKPQAYNKQANAERKTIQVLAMPQANVRLFVFNAVGNNFGLIGMLLTEADRNNKENWLQGKVAEQQFNQFTTFKTTFDQQMSERGYRLVWPEPLTHEAKEVRRDKNGLRKQYAAVQGVDAQMDIGVNFVGFAAAGSGKSQPYRPTVLVTVRLLDPSGKQVLFQDQILYHNVVNTKGAVIVEPDPAYAYPKFDDLKAADATAVKGLAEAVAKSALALSEQF
jgi:hypothetical protein